MCATALLAGLFNAPSAAAQTPTTTRSIAAATDECPYSVATYAEEKVGISRTLRKYVAWNPKNGGGTFLDTGYSKALPTGSAAPRYFAGGNQRIYESGGLLSGTLKSYQDQTATGGNLLSLEYTFAERAGQDWHLYSKIWTDADGRVVNLDDAGNLNVYVIQMPDGTPASVRMSRLAQLAASSPAVVELRKSTRIWSAGNMIYGQSGDVIRAWDYSAALNSITLGPSAEGTVQASGLADADTAWSPAPGIVYTKTQSGTVKSQTGTPLQLVKDDVALGIPGKVFANAASCLSDGADEKPYFGQRPNDSNVPLAPPEPSPTAPPSGPAVVSGKFLLGDGRPAAGMQVVVEASDLLPDDNSAVDLPDLGTVTTAADGTWSLTIPDSLPAAVQTAVTDNGGALNVTATTVGRTESGVMLVGSDSLTAAPKNPATGTRTTFAASVSEQGAHTVKLLPALADPETDLAEPTSEQRSTTFASAVDAQPTYDPELQTPMWQSDRGPAPQSYNPYLIDGTDISTQSVTPYADTCYWETSVIARQIAYTVVGESHGYWDAAGNVEYESNVASTLDVGYSIKGDLWSVSGSASVGTSNSAVVGFSWRGPYWAKQWKIPLEYTKNKKTYSCGGVAIKSHYEIRAGRFKLPAGGAPGVYGKDARQLDGQSRFNASNPAYRSHLMPMGTFAVKVGKSVKWSGAAVVFGVSLGGSTSYDSSHRQNYRAGGRTTYRHDVWGLRANLDGEMGMLYSY
ncbi:hypothetical protein [Streptomyces sp. NPDC005408]|uniref:hypothetical protein n=1 Tax=Streptomyces sp. NPDC005408 TaxID=3155341 RepID=UPI0033BBF7EA